MTTEIDRLTGVVYDARRDYMARGMAGIPSDPAEARKQHISYVRSKIALQGAEQALEQEILFGGDRLTRGHKSFRFN